MKKYLSIVILVICVFMFVACQNNLEENMNNDVGINLQESGEKLEDNTDVKTGLESEFIEKIYEDKELVYNAYLGGNNGELKIPFINIDSEDANKINTQLSKVVNEIEYQRMNEEKFQNDDSIWLDWYEQVNYNYFFNDDILSVVVTYSKGYVAGHLEYETYNINTKTGKILTTLELVNAGRNEENQISNEKFLEAMEDLYMNELYEKNVEESINLNIGYDGITKTYKEMMQELIPTDANEVIAYKGENNVIYVYTSIVTGAGQSGSTYFVNAKLDI